MNFKIAIFSIIVIMFNSLSIRSMANSQTAETFSMSDGLPSNAVFDIFEDSRGLVWLATDAGLYEFTGEDVKFRKSLERLQGERVNSICEDSDGNLWLSSLGLGLSKFDGELLSSIELDSLKKDLEIYCVDNYGPENNLLIGTSNGLYEFEDGKIFRNLKNNSCSNGILKIRKADNHFVVICNRQPENFISRNNLQSGKNKSKEDLSIINLGVQKDFAKTKMVLEGEKSFRLNLSNGKSVIADVIEQEENSTLAFYLVRYFEKGLEKRKVLKFQENTLIDFSAINNLNYYFINTIFLRNGQNDLWFGTQNYGVVKVKNSFLKYIKTGFDGFQNLESQDLVVDGNGNVIVSSSNGLIIVNNLKITKRFSTNNFIQKCVGSSNGSNSITLNSLGLDKKGLIWISSNKGFFTLNTSTYQLKFVGISPAKKFVFTNDGKILCFWNNTFSFYCHSGKCNEKFSYSFSKSSTIEIRKIITQGDNIWIATRQKGIIKYKDGQFSIYNRKNTGIHNVVNDLIVANDSTLIAAGNNGLIYRLKYTENSFEVIDSIGKGEGIVGSAIQGFQLLDDNSLWCGTNTGVHRLEYNTWQKDSTLQFRIWNLNDGYYDLNGQKSVVDADQNIWVQTRNRLLKIDSKRYNEQDQLKTRISLRRILVHNKEWGAEKTQMDKWTNTPIEPVAFKYFENDLTFNFGMDFCQNISNVRFRYYLEGYDKTWSDWTKDTKAMYSHLPGGDYFLRIEGRQLSDSDIIPFSFHIKIKMQWWKTWWFILLSSCILIIILIVTAKVYARIVRRKEKSKTKQFNRVIALKMKSLQNQLDPHFIFNALNSIQSHILEENTENALDYLSDFSMVLRKNINNANKDLISLSDEINYLQHYLKLEQMRFYNKFSYEINVDSSINPHKFQLPPMLIQPFIENAVKYGLSGGNENGELILFFEAESDGYLKCIIKDNGIGRKKSKGLHQDGNIGNHHKTLLITKDRIKLLNKVLNNGRVYSYSIEDLTDENQNPCGTKVEIGFPKASQPKADSH